MAFPQSSLDPANNAVDRIRLRIGDVFPYDIEYDEALYEYFLSINGDDETLAAIQAVEGLVAKYSRAMEERSGELEAKYREKLLGYRELLVSLKRGDLSGAVYTPFASGADNPNPFKVGTATTTEFV